MTWLFGYHFKWRICKKIAAAKGLKVRSPEFLTTAVEHQIRKDSRVKFWISYDWAHRPIITFFENKTECDPTGIRFTVEQVATVAIVMGIRRVAPRWYSTDDDEEAVYESESSDDDEIEMGNIPENPWLSKATPADLLDDDSSDEEWEESETETEAQDGETGKGVENLREDVQELEI